MADFVIPSLRGGLNEDPPTALQDDNCTVATNVEYWLSMLGERRLGSLAINLAGSPLQSCDQVIWLARHFYTQDPADTQLWGFGTRSGVPVLAVQARGGAWYDVAMPDPPVVNGKDEYAFNGQDFNGKLFLAYRSPVDRLHCFDHADPGPPYSLRRVGLAASATAPTAVDQGAGTGTMAGLRYYRARWIVWNGTAVTRRSEPSAVLQWTPNNATAVLLSAPTPRPNEGENYWEGEASIDGFNFYRVGRVAIGATITDTANYNHGYAQDFPLSAQSGDYELLPSVKFLTVEQNRLMGANLWMRANQKSTVVWTPVLNDITSDSNDERLPVATANSLGLDENDGGELTALSATVNGYVYAMKLTHTYQLTRSGLRAHAYEAVPLTKQRGALIGSMIEALDQSGNPSPFFLDPDIGPCRIGPRGVEPCGIDLRKTWETINLDAVVPARGLYFPEKQQVMFWIAVGTATTPNKRLVLHTQEMRATQDGMRRGWTVWDGPSANALCACLFADNVNSTGPRSNVLKPFIGLQGNGLVWQTDLGDTDNGQPYHAMIRTKPYVHGNLMNQFECHSAMLLAGAVPGGQVDITLRADFGRQVRPVRNVSLAPVSTESRVIKNLDNLGLAEMRTLQVTIEDAASGPTTQWSLEQFAIREVSGARA